MYIAIIGDIINSRKIKEREKAQNKLKTILEEVNKEFKDIVASNLTITLGDEFQGLLLPKKEIFLIIDIIEKSFKPYALRFGIGYGEISTHINKEISIGADGPAYWRAREAIIDVHDNHQYSVRKTGFLSSSKENDQLFNNMLALTDFIKSKWSKTQLEIYEYLLDERIYSEDFEQKKLAKKINMNPSAFQKRLKSSGLKLYLKSKSNLGEILEITGGKNE